MFETEVPLLEKYLKIPNVELALDPEFSMRQVKNQARLSGRWMPQM